MQNKKLQPVNKKWTWRKPKGKPKRPLSAYNIFFADVRQDLLTARKNEHGIGFQNLAQAVAKKWKELDPTLKLPYIEKAKIAMERYKVELSMWESTQTNLKKRSILVPDDEVAALKMITPLPENSMNSNVLNSNAFCNEGSIGIISRISASQRIPFTCTSGIASNTGPTHLDDGVDNRINEHIYSQTLADELHLSSNRLGIPADPSACDHCISTACITPTLHRRRLCSSNDTRSNIFYADDTYEPLPLSNYMEPYHDRLKRLAEEQNVLGYQNFELFPSATADIYRPSTTGEVRSVMNSNERVNNFPFSTPQDAIQDQSSNDDPNNSTWNTMQLERLLRTLENEDWNRFL